MTMTVDAELVGRFREKMELHNNHLSDACWLLERAALSRQNGDRESADREMAAAQVNATLSIAAALGAFVVSMEQDA